MSSPHHDRDATNFGSTPPADPAATRYSDAPPSPEAVAAAPVCEERRLIVAFAAGAAALIAVDRMTCGLQEDAR